MTQNMDDFLNLKLREKGKERERQIEKYEILENYEKGQYLTDSTKFYHRNVLEKDIEDVNFPDKL